MMHELTYVMGVLHESQALVIKHSLIQMKSNKLNLIHIS